MDAAFIRSLQEKARANHARIGIGVWKADADLIYSLKSATRYADLVLVGDAGSGCDCKLDPVGNLDVVRTEEPWSELVRLLKSGEIDGAVRGNLPAGRTMKCLAREFNIKVRRLALVEQSGWAFLLGPVGIDEGESLSDRLELAVQGARFLQSLGVLPRVSVLSAGRMEDRGRSERVDRSLDEGEQIAALAREAGVDAAHKGILIESCRGDDIVIAPEGVSGNLIFRTLLLVCGANSFGAPVLMDRVFVDSSRARSGFDGPVMLASCMAGATSKNRRRF